MPTQYNNKLRSPKWQRKRLSILARDQFACVLCNDTETTLNVHHVEYNGDPWNTPDDKLLTVCEHCHQLLEFKDFIPVLSHSVHKTYTTTGIYFSLFDIQGAFRVYFMQGERFIRVFGLNDGAKKLVHFIMDFWLRNDLQHNLKSNV